MAQKTQEKMEFGVNKLKYFFHHYLRHKIQIRQSARN